MTDDYLKEDLNQAVTAMAMERLETLSRESAALFTHAAAVVARSAWVDFINKSEGQFDGASDATNRELARAYTALNDLVEKSEHLKEEK